MSTHVALVCRFAAAIVPCREILDSDERENNRRSAQRDEKCADVLHHYKQNATGEANDSGSRFRFEC